jgi:hypothetical protein
MNEYLMNRYSTNILNFYQMNAFFKEESSTIPAVNICLQKQFGNKLTIGDSELYITSYTADITFGKGTVK